MTLTRLPTVTGRILVVDDVADNRALLRRRLEQRGFTVIEAEDGHEALQRIASDTFDLVLLDVMMPGLSGLQVLAEIRLTYPPALLPVVMATARSETADIVQALGAGANDYVTKPIDFPIVLARVVAQIERRNTELALREANEALRISNDKLLVANDRLSQQVMRERTYKERIDFLAHRDTLTGLANRTLLERHLHGAAGARSEASVGRISVLMVEGDGLRNVRDALGHAAGDALVQSIADQLRACVGNDGLLARVGANEYAILHRSSDPLVTAGSLAARIITQLGQCRTLDGHDFGLRTCVGIALPEDGVEGATLLERAELALQQAKVATGETYRFFHMTMDAEARGRLRLELDLRRAVSDGDFQLHYQPILDLREDTVVAYEALLRWSHRERGPISPAEFIPLAERTGMIVTLGEWVLRSACQQARNWPEHIAVAVNISPRQFEAGTLVDAVRAVLEESRLAPSRLQLEITESVMLSNDDVNLGILRELRGLGVRIAMDDFGTGYSSLGYLRSFRFDKVKIDKSFVRDMCEEAASRAIVRAVVALGQSFGIVVTAEGVETEEQLSYLRLEGCGEVQGYLLGRPQPPERIEGCPDLRCEARAA